MSHRIAVFGGSGRLGTLVCTALEQHAGLAAVAVSRHPGRAGERGRPVDLTELSSIAEALHGMDAAVVAAPQGEPLVQTVCAGMRIPCVDVTPRAELLEQAEERLDPPAPSVMMCGLLPGLSGMLARHAASRLDELTSLRVGFLQSTNADVGLTGTRDMLRMISRPVPTDGGETPGFSRRRTMRFGRSVEEVRIIRHEEASVLRRRLTGAEAEYCTAWQSSPFNGLLAALSRAGLLPRLANSRLPIRPRHDPRKPQAVLLTAEARGMLQGRPDTQVATVEAFSDYGATALITAEILRKTLIPGAVPPGVQTPMDHLELTDLEPLFDGGPLTLHHSC